MAAGARAEGCGAALVVAGVAGMFLLWRGLLGGRLFPLLAGALILRRTFRLSGLGGALAGVARRRAPEVIEVKSPAELEPGFVSASPQPTFRSRVDRDHER